MVRGLIKNNEMRAPEGDPGEHHSRLLAIRKSFHWRHLCLSRNTEATEGAPQDGGFRDVGVLLPHPLQRRELHVNLIHKVLVKTSHNAVGVLCNIAGGRLQLAAHKLGQRRLSSAIIHVHTDLQVLEKRFAARIRKAHLTELQHGWRKITGARDGEVHLAILHDNFGETATRHLGESLFLRLSLAGQFGATVTETSNVLLHVFDLVLLPSVFLHLITLLLRTCNTELIVVTVVHVQLLDVHVADLGADVVHKILGVRHHEKDVLEVAEIVLEPHNGLNI
eukprot:gene4065-gene2261